MKYLKIILSISVFVILLYMSVFFRSYYILSGAFCYSFIIVADILLFFIPFGTVEVEITSSKTNYTKGEKGEIYIKLKNKKLFPIYRAEFDPVLKNKFYKADKVSIKTPLPILMPKTITIPVSMEKSGVVAVFIESIKYSDAFGIMSRSVNVNTAYSVIVMPNKINIDTTHFGEADSDEIPAVNVYLSNSGDVSGYKEYGQGDRTNSINWKLFARTDKLYVREFERTSADEAVVLMDMNINNLDKAIDIIYSIGCKNGVYTLLWLPCGNEEFESQCISDEETLNNTIYRIYDSAPDTAVNKGLDTYKRLYRENKVLYVSDKMELL